MSSIPSVKLVAIAAGVMVFYSFLGVLLGLLAGGSRVASTLVSFVLSCLLAWSLLQGWNPGRWFAIVGFSLQCIAGVGGAFTSFTHSISFALILLISGIVSGACACALFTASDHFE